MRDNQEEKLIEELIELFKECEKYADISKVKTKNDDEVYSFDLVSADGVLVKPQTYQLNGKDKAESQKLEESLNVVLKGHDNVAIVTLLRMLKGRINK